MRLATSVLLPALLAVTSIVPVGLLTNSAQGGFLAVGAAIIAPNEPNPAGGIIIASSVIPFGTPLYTGTLVSQVISGDISNPYGPTALTFTYQLINNGTSINALTRFSINDYAGFLIDASYLGGGGIAPLSIDRFTADTVGYNFSSLFGGAGPVVPGSASALMVLQTNSTNFVVTTAAIQDGLNTTALSFAPTAIPEPGSMLLLGSAIGVVSVMRRRRS